MSDISRRSRRSICQSFLTRVNLYYSNPLRSGETSRPRDFVARSVAARPDAFKLASITFKNEIMRGRLVTSPVLNLDVHCRVNGSMII